MAGILDSKKRIIDGVVTQEGKRQISMGGLRPVFATVADKYSYYEKDVVSGSSDATKRIYFESPIQSINDSIVMETDDSGKLLGYPVRGKEFYRADGVVEGVDSVSGTLTFASMDTVTGFASLATSIVTQSLYRFKNLMSIGTRDSNESLGLQTRLSKYSHNFAITNTSPFNEGKITAITDLDYLEPLFWDERLSNVINFKFLPPVTEKLTNIEKQNLNLTSVLPASKMFGSYTKVNRPFRLTYDQIMDHLNTPIANDVIATMRGYSPAPAIVRVDDEDSPRPAFIVHVEGESSSTESEAEVFSEDVTDMSAGESSEYSYSGDGDGGSRVYIEENPPREVATVFFNSTSNTNNLVMQLFELDESKSRLLKLDVIDFGEVYVGESAARPEKRVFFAGKIFINSIGLPCYVNLFTIIMD